MDALREAILNAVIHRDYSIHTEGTPIQIDFFTDRVESHSPGSLYGRMSIEQLGIAKPDLRNPALAVMAETLTTAEHRYSGIPTMRNAMKESGLPEPKFENRRNEFVVTFYNKEDPEKATLCTTADHDWKISHDDTRKAKEQKSKVLYRLTDPKKASASRSHCTTYCWLLPPKSDQDRLCSADKDGLLGPLRGKLRKVS